MRRAAVTKRSLRRLRLGAALVAAIVLPSRWIAAEELSLQAALELAQASSPTLAAARARAAAARAEAEGVARSTRWPRLAATGGWTVTDQPAAVFAQRLDAGALEERDLAIERLTAPGSHAHLGTTLGLEIPIDAFAKGSPQRRGALAAARAAEQAAVEAELETALRVATAWHGAVVAARAVVATEHALGGAVAREGVLDAELAEGAALRADLLRVRTRRRRLEGELASRRGEHRTALAALALAVGAGRPIEPAGEPAAPDPPGELAPWLASSETAPGVEAARAAVEAAAARAESEARSARPDLLLSTQMRDDRGPLDQGAASGLAAALLRWSLYDPQRAPRRAAAAAARAAAEAGLDAAREESRFRIEAAWHRAVAAHERWAAARGGTEEGREALRVVRERRAAGLATLTDELETEAASLAAELDELAASAEAAVTAAALRRAAARRLPEVPP